MERTNIPEGNIPYKGNSLFKSVPSLNRDKISDQLHQIFVHDEDKQPEGIKSKPMEVDWGYMGQKSRRPGVLVIDPR